MHFEEGFFLIWDRVPIFVKLHASSIENTQKSDCFLRISVAILTDVHRSGLVKVVEIIVS